MSQTTACTGDTAIEAGTAEATAPEELARMNDMRASQYALLARLFRVEVDQQLLDELKAMRFPAKTGNAAANKGYRLIASYLSGAWTDPVTDLAIDYVRTFIGHGVDTYSAAYPFESVYTSQRRLLMQGARDEVRAIYRAEGLDKQESWREGEDHVALELEFMQTLAQRTADALRRGDIDAATAALRTQRNFLEDHLTSWVPMMTTDMRRFAATDFYRGLASLLDGTLAVDAEFLADVLDDAESSETA